MKQFVTDYLNSVSGSVGEYYTAGSDSATEGTFIWVQDRSRNVEDDYKLVGEGWIKMSQTVCSKL